LDNKSALELIAKRLAAIGQQLEKLAALAKRVAKGK
jgi:hypothetical protein